MECYFECDNSLTIGQRSAVTTLTIAALTKRTHRLRTSLCAQPEPLVWRLRNDCRFCQLSHSAAAAEHLVWKLSQCPLLTHSIR